MEAGKHVSCQKPMCTTIADADEIIAAADRARTKFRVTENFIYSPPILKAKRLLDAWAIDEPSLLLIHSTMRVFSQRPRVTADPEALIWRRDPQLNPGRMVFDDSVHKYATARKWLGDIESVFGIEGKS